MPSDEATKRILTAVLAGGLGVAIGAVAVSVLVVPSLQEAAQQQQPANPPPSGGALVVSPESGSGSGASPRAASLGDFDADDYNKLPTSQADCDRMGARIHFHLTYAGSGAGCTGHLDPKDARP